MWIAKEGLREIAIATAVLAPGAWALAWLWPPLTILPAILWFYVLSFFRDPPRKTALAPGELCSPADGTVWDVSEVSHHADLQGPAIQVSIFLSLFNVHINRMPCAGTVRSTSHRPGQFLDARDSRAATHNECNTLLIEPDPPIAGPIVVRQVAGLVARRIVCHAQPGQHWAAGGRFGLIKFGSRTELIIPQRPGAEILVRVGDKVRGGLSVVARYRAGGS